MFTSYLALVSNTPAVKFSDLTQVSAALQKQITRDFSPIWKKPATIDAFASLDDVPSDYWPIVITDDIGTPNASGVHMDSNGQPYALVATDSDISLTCSHECLEMLADPFGNRLVASNSIMQGQGRVNYLVEVCDPSESSSYAYEINGIRVSDFYTPHFFDPFAAPGTRYSCTGALKAPRQILPGGYISWQVPETGEWWQAFHNGNKLEYRSLGRLSKQDGKSWREIIDSATTPDVLGTQPRANKLALTAFRDIRHITTSIGRGKQLREDIAAAITKK